MPMNPQPGILDQGFLQNIPNVLPAGTAPWLSNQPTQTLPNAGEVRPEWNSVWIKPGMLLEPGTGFGNEGANAADLASLQFPAFRFGMPGFGFDMGLPIPFSGGTSPGDTQAPGASENDYLGSLMKLGTSTVKALTSGGGSAQTFFGNDAVDQAKQDVWGFDREPKFNTGADTTISSGLPDEFNVNPAWRGVNGLPGASPNPAVQNFYNFSNEPNFSVMGSENLPTLEPGQFTTGMNPVLNTSGFAPQSWANPLAAAAAAAPFAARMITKDPTALASTDLGAGLGGFAAAAAGSAPILAPLAVLPIGMGIHELGRATGKWGHSNVPTGYYNTGPGGSDNGVYANPETGVTIRRDGRFGFVPTEQTQAGQPISPEQALQWGLPIPGVTINQGNVNPALRAILGRQSLDVNADQTPGPSWPTANDYHVTLDDVLEAQNPGRTAWTPQINQIQQASPELSPGEIWRRWTVSPEGQAWVARQTALSQARSEWNRG